MAIKSFDFDYDGTPSTIEYEDDSGKITKKVIPKAEFRKSLLIYNLNVDKVADYSWLSYGMTEGFEHELEQDVYVYTKTQSDIRWDLDKYNKDIFVIII